MPVPQGQGYSWFLLPWEPAQLHARQLLFARLAGSCIIHPIRVGISLVLHGRFLCTCAFFFVFKCLLDSAHGDRMLYCCCSARQCRAGLLVSSWVLSDCLKPSTCSTCVGRNLVTSTRIVDVILTDLRGGAFLVSATSCTYASASTPRGRHSLVLPMLLILCCDRAFFSILRGLKNMPEKLKVKSALIVTFSFAVRCPNCRLYFPTYLFMLTHFYSIVSLTCY